MSTALVTLQRGISSEALKIKRTWAFWLSVLAPLSIVGMNFLVFYFKGDRIVKPGQDPWGLWAGNNFSITAQLLVPLFLALITALVNGMEHNSLGWKQLYAAPVPRWSVFLNKFLLLLGLVVLTYATFLVGVLLGGYALGYTRPHLKFQDYHHVATISLAAFRILVASLFIFTLQFYISFRFKSIAMGIGLGILFTLAFLVASRWEHIGYYPYSWPSFAAMAFYAQEKAVFIPQMWYSLGSSLFLLLIGVWESIKRQVF
ncbi:ABC transporter permease [Rufibacter sp. LB8]|uniref:ABC transporter permease n=1 Tax=Rufibacter sp. LB8 TaxID=2777781 RepID=UPI00178C1F2D|nr:ABC transporter permease [Rufibacter sp. LB8]